MGHWRRSCPGWPSLVCSLCQDDSLPALPSQDWLPNLQDPVQKENLGPPFKKYYEFYFFFSIMNFDTAEY